MQDALSGEMIRRQELLRAAGNFASLRDYEKARAAGAAAGAAARAVHRRRRVHRAALGASREFIDLFVTIGRLGRSLGVHLLLASPAAGGGPAARPGDATCRTGSACARSPPWSRRTVLGVPDAYELPRRPGHGLPQVPTPTLMRFKAAYVSGPYRSGRRAGPAAPAAAGIAGRRPFTSRQPRPDRRAGRPDAAEAARGRSVDDSGSRCSTSSSTGCAATGPPAHQVWLPPLDGPADPRRAAARARRRPAARPASPRLAASAACGCRSASSTGRSSSAATRWWSTCPARPGTSPSSAARRAARPPRCAR